jgi:hypothetical protein
MIFRLFKLIGRLLLSVVAAMLCYAAYGFYAEKKASHEATEFCKSIKPGEQTESVISRAEQAGADRRSLKWIQGTEESKLLMVTFAGLPPFSRHVCTVKAGARVTQVDYSHVD